MSIGEAFEQAMKYDYVDLQALIMFLVFEKQVLTMEDNTKELDIYFKEKHNQRINKELHAYKSKMNINYGPSVHEIETTNQTLFIYAHSQKQAEFIAYQNMIKIDQIKLANMDELVSNNGKNIRLRDLVKGKSPCLLGGYDVTNYKSLRTRNQISQS